MNLRLKKISIENFKGITQLLIDFHNRTTISGQNATGKTTIMDAFTWLLFNKDSEGKADFNIRPNNRQGEPIDNLVIKVSAVLEKDGKDILLCKKQEQNWVKKKGSEVSQLQGNINKYEINEIPKTEKDYKAYIDDLMKEELFKLITSPQAFTSLKWKDQRTILLKLVSEVTDQDVISTNQKFSPLSEVLSEFSVDDLTAKAKKALKELNNRQAELPARIDEASKGLVQADFAECENQKADLEKQINDLTEQENNASKASEALTQINNAIMQKQFDLGDLKRKANEKLMDQRREIQRKIDDAGYSFSDAIREFEKTEREIKQKQELLESNRSYREVLLKITKKSRPCRLMRILYAARCVSRCFRQSRERLSWRSLSLISKRAFLTLLRMENRLLQILKLLKRRLASLKQSWKPVRPIRWSRISERQQPWKNWPYCHSRLKYLTVRSIRLFLQRLKN